MVEEAAHCIANDDENKVFYNEMTIDSMTQS